jgi:phosphohistidine phosphatase
MASGKILMLMRHAKSSWDDPTRDDFDRPLNPRGRKAAAVMAAHIERSGLWPQLVLCSAAARARQTVAALAELEPSTEVSTEQGLYGATSEQLLDRLEILPAAIDRALVVGHNPGLHDLGRAMATQGDRPALQQLSERFPTAALVVLECGASWSEIRQAPGWLVSFVSPRGMDEAEIPPRQHHP